MADTITLVITGPDSVVHTSSITIPPGLSTRLIAAFHTILDTTGTNTDDQIVAGMVQQMFASIAYGTYNQEKTAAVNALVLPTIFPAPSAKPA